jgi:hypothetical protein
MDLPNSSVVEDSDDTYQFETNVQLSENLISLSHQLDYVEYCFIKTLAEFDRRNAWKEPGVLSCSYWLNVHCDMSYCTAREKVRISHKLEHLPQISEEFKKGTLSYSKVRSMTCMEALMP